MNRALVLASLLALQGCAALDRMSTEEKAWQVMNVVDGMQTLSIARNPKCYREHDALSRAMIGDHPSETEVVALTVGYGVGHYYMSRFLEAKAPRWASKVWEYTTIGAKGFTIGNNHNIGLPLIPEDMPGCQ